MTKRILYIDGPNLYATTQALHLSIDYKKLLEYFNADGNLLRACYYTAVDNSEDYSAIRPVLDWMEFNGFSLITKDAKVQYDKDNVKRIKGNMDIELCVEAMLMGPIVTEAYIFSGDGDFVPLVRALKMMGNRVFVVSTLETQPAVCSPQLRREADTFVELRSLNIYKEESWHDGKRNPRLVTPSGR